MAIGVFVSGSENKQLGWIVRETISEVERMGKMENLKIVLYLSGERNFISIKLIVS